MQPGPRRSSLFLVWLGFAVNALYDSATSSVWIVRERIEGVPLPGIFWNQLSYWVNVAALLYALVAVGVMARSIALAPGPHARRDRAILAAVLPLPVLAAFLEAAVAPHAELFDSPFKLVVNGVVRVSLAVLPAYALLRYRVFDIDLRVKWTVRHGTVLAILAGLFFVVSNAMQAILDVDGFLPNFAAALAIALALKPAELASRHLTNRFMPGVEDTTAYRRERRLQMYRHAMESALEDGEVTGKERRVLATLARELELPADEAQRIERAAQRERVRPLEGLDVIG